MIDFKRFINCFYGKIFMKNKYLLMILLLPCTFKAMDDPRQIPQDKPGIFLDQIVSEYKNPVRISQVPLEAEPYKERGFRQYSCREDLQDRIKHLAVVTGDQTHFFKREIETDIQNASNCGDLHLIETACLRVEDLSKADKKTFIWLYRQVNNSDNKNKLKGSVRVDFNTTETFEFNRENAISTLVTLTLAHKDNLHIHGRNQINVKSKTNNFLDPSLQNLLKIAGGDL